MKTVFAILFALCLTAGSLPAADDNAPNAQNPSPGMPQPLPGMPKTPPMQGRPAVRHRENVLFWRVMSSLSKEERKTLMETQAKNPDEFRKEIQKRMEALRAKEAEMEQKFRRLTEDYRNTDSEEKRRQIRTELTAMVRERFMQRMADSERNLQDMKRRTAMLEKELARKKANADQEIERLADQILSGETPHFRQGPPHKGKHGAAPLPPLPTPDKKQ